MIKAVIFDMDGVLLDSQPVHFKADIAVLAKCGLPVTQDVVERYAGMANHNRWAKYKQDFALTQSVGELMQMHREVLNGILNEEKPVPVKGVRDLLEKIKAKGYKTAVASSSSREFVFKVLDLTYLLHFFDELICGEDAANGKPAPDIFLAAADRLNTKPSECVIFEDSSNGVKAAHNAGIKCIGYRNETSGIQDLSMALVIIDSFHDLAKITELLPL